MAGRKKESEEEEEGPLVVLTLLDLAALLLAVLLPAAAYRGYAGAREELEAARAELNVTARSNQDILIFNRVPKVGSNSINNLVGHLRERNDFRAFTSLEYMPVTEGTEDIIYSDDTIRKVSTKTFQSTKSAVVQIYFF